MVSPGRLAEVIDLKRLAPIDVALAFVAFGALVIWRLPPWLVVLLTAAGGAAIAAAHMG